MSTITEGYKTLGRFSLTLDQPPQEIVDDLELRGHIVISYGRMLSAYASILSRAELLARSIYTGRIQKLTFQFDGTVVVEGVGLLVWLGDANGHGPTSSSAIAEATATTPNTFLTSALSTARRNGLTYGGVETGYNVSSGTVAPGYAARVVTREGIDEVIDKAWGVPIPYRVRPNGEFYVGDFVGDELVGATPDTTDLAGVLVTREGLGAYLPASNGELVGLKATDVETELDGSDYATDYYAQTAGGSFVSAAQAGTHPRDFGGSTAAEIHVVETSGDGTTGEATKRAQAEITKHVDTTSVRVTVEHRLDLPSLVKPGDVAAVFDPRTKLTDETGPTVRQAARSIHPAYLRIYGMTWPLVDGYGVTFTRNNWAAAHDLSPYVRRAGAGATTTLDVGSPRRRKLSRVTEKQRAWF